MGQEPSDIAREVVSAIGEWRGARIVSEEDLQRRVWEHLQAGRLNVYRERATGPSDRPDFLVGLRLEVAVECKVKGSALDLERQVRRYARTPSIAAVVVVTTRRRHTLPRTIEGKPVHVVCWSVGL